MRKKNLPAVRIFTRIDNSWSWQLVTGRKLLVPTPAKITCRGEEVETWSWDLDLWWPLTKGGNRRCHHFGHMSNLRTMSNLWSSNLLYDKVTQSSSWRHQSTWLVKAITGSSRNGRSWFLPCETWSVDCEFYWEMQFARTSDFRFKLGGAKMFLRKFC